MPMIFALVDLAREWINENNEKFRVVNKGEADSQEESNMQELSTLQSLKDRSEVINAKGGKWNSVIGLIGTCMLYTPDDNDGDKNNNSNNNDDNNSNGNSNI